MENIDKIKKDFFTINKIENFLPEVYSNEIEDLLTSTNFPWFYVDKVAYNDLYKKELNYYGFAHTVYKNIDNEFVKSNYFDFFYPMTYFMENFNPKKIIRIRIGMQTKTSDEIIIDPFHKDYDFDHKTLLYYVNDSDGDTYFYEDNFGENIFYQNSPQKNSAVVFNGLVNHSSSHPRKNNSRIAININYID